MAIQTIEIQDKLYFCGNDQHLAIIGGHCIGMQELDEITVHTKCLPRNCKWLKIRDCVRYVPHETSTVTCPYCGASYEVLPNQGVVLCECGWRITNQAFLEVDY